MREDFFITSPLLSTVFCAYLVCACPDDAGAQVHPASSRPDRFRTLRLLSSKMLGSASRSMTPEGALSVVAGCSALTKIPNEVATGAAIDTASLLAFASTSVTPQFAEAEGYESAVGTAALLMLHAITVDKAKERMAIISEVTKALGTISKSRLYNMLYTEPPVCSGKEGLYSELRRVALNRPASASSSCRGGGGDGSGVTVLIDTKSSGSAAGAGRWGVSPGLSVMTLPGGWGPSGAAESAEIVGLDIAVPTGTADPCLGSSPLKPCVEVRHVMSMERLNSSAVADLRVGRGISCWWLQHGQLEWKDDRCAVSGTNISRYNESVDSLNGSFVSVKCSCWAAGAYSATYRSRPSHSITCFLPCSITCFLPCSTRGLLFETYSRRDCESQFQPPQIS